MVQGGFRNGIPIKGDFFQLRRYMPELVSKIENLLLVL